MIVRGHYPREYPEGCVVHFSAGNDFVSSIEWGRLNGFGFFSISKEGKIIQATPLDSWSYHAGVSHYPGLGDGLSRRLVGIELHSAGKLEKKNGKYYTWFNKEIPEKDVRVCEARDNIEFGYYEKFTEIQELALVTLILWLFDNNRNVFNLDYILGHQEICVPHGRKNDPNGCLSMSMPEYRNYIKGKR